MCSCSLYVSIHSTGGQKVISVISCWHLYLEWAVRLWSGWPALTGNWESSSSSLCEGDSAGCAKWTSRLQAVTPAVSVPVVACYSVELEALFFFFSLDKKKKEWSSIIIDAQWVCFQRSAQVLRLPLNEDRLISALLWADCLSCVTGLQLGTGKI